MSNHVARRASEATGNALLRVAAATFPEAEETTLKPLRKRLRGDPTLRGHHAPLFGFIVGLVSRNGGAGGSGGGIDGATAGRMLLFSILRDLVSAAVRLNLVGPFEASALQRRLCAAAEQTVRERARSSSSSSFSGPDGPSKVELEAASSSSSSPSAATAEASAARVEVWQTDPILDLIQGSHDQLYSRLFVS